MDNEKRLIIAIALSVVILVAFAWLSPKPEPQPQPAASEPTAIEEPVESRLRARAAAAGSAAEEVDEADGATEQDEPAIAAEREEEIRVDNGLFEVVFTNRGGRVRTWTLLHYTTADGAPLQLFPQFEEGGHYPLSVDLDDPALTDELNNALYRIERERLASDGSTGGERIKFTLVGRPRPRRREDVRIPAGRLSGRCLARRHRPRSAPSRPSDARARIRGAGTELGPQQLLLREPGGVGRRGTSDPPQARQARGRGRVLGPGLLGSASRTSTSRR